MRELRRGRRWTQAELSARLGLSQARLSEIERGAGSFTAEQFLLILKLFNATVSDFTVAVRDVDAEIQNALARLGALHLHESSDVLPSAQIESVGEALREGLAAGSPRLITALAPVLVLNVNRVNLKKLRAELTEAGLERRLDWLVDNTIDALRNELAHGKAPRPWTQRYRRALLVLETFLDFVRPPARAGSSPREAYAPDVLDSHIRSKETLKEVATSSSPNSQRWGIVTTLQPEDFVSALKAARARG